MKRFYPTYEDKVSILSCFLDNEELAYSLAKKYVSIHVYNNIAKVKKDGIYRFTLNTNLNATERKQKDVSYYVNLNGKEAFSKNQRNIPSNGEYYFQIQLKANDSVAFNIKASQELHTEELCQKVRAFGI